jgi:hypothetical protein
VPSAEQQTLFLQNMLKSTAMPAKAMTSQVVSGTVSAATATGFLPQYRGSAAASLAPAISNMLSNGPESDEYPVSKADNLKDSMNVPALLPGHRQLSRAQPTINPSPNKLGAEGYMRFLAQKADDDKKIIEQGWNVSNGRSDF